MQRKRGEAPAKNNFLLKQLTKIKLMTFLYTSSLMNTFCCSFQSSQDGLAVFM
jgi:hypothetical protein